jgi:hypothetical protein
MMFEKVPSPLLPSVGTPVFGPPTPNSPLQGAKEFLKILLTSEAPSVVVFPELQNAFATFAFHLLETKGQFDELFQVPRLRKEKGDITIEVDVSGVDPGKLPRGVNEVTRVSLDVMQNRRLTVQASIVVSGQRFPDTYTCFHHLLQGVHVSMYKRDTPHMLWNGFKFLAANLLLWDKLYIQHDSNFHELVKKYLTPPPL